MTYASRIPADGKYLVALGRAFYNFTYLEWIVISTIAKLSTQGHEAVPRRQSAEFMARALLHVIESTEPLLGSARWRGSRAGRELAMDMKARR